MDNLINVKKNFKILRDNNGLIYLNSGASSLKPDIVIKKLSEVYENNITTIGKSFVHNEKNDILKEFSNSLDKISNFIGAPEKSVVPVSGTTDGLNKIATNIINSLNDGDEIILGRFEHSSNILPWVNIAKLVNKKIVFKWYEIKDFKIDVDHLKKIVTKKTQVISLAHTFNTFGTKNNIEEVRKVIGNKIKIVVDAAQSIGHTKIDVEKMDCDYLVFGAHKAFGPHGLGFVYIKDIDNQPHPFIYGGNMNKTYSEESIVFKRGINMFMGGTQDVPGVIAFGTSIDYMNRFGIDNIEKHNNELKKYAEKKLIKIPNINIINKDVMSPNLFFEIKGVSGEDVSYHLSLDKIIVRSGSSCVKIKNDIYKQHKAIRVSFHIYNDKNDIDKLYDSLLKGGDFLGSLFRKKSPSSTCI